MESNRTVIPIKKVLTGQLSSVPTALYLILVLLGILGNALVISVVGENIVREHGGGRSSDMILVNMAFSNLMVSVTRNILLVVSDLGLEVSPNKDCCQLLMGIWVWLRSVNVWSTFFLSAFHFHILRRIVPPIVSVNGTRGPPKALLTGFCFIWTFNLIYSVPAFVYSTNGGENATETLMLVSSTTRPLLGCLWDFPSTYSGLAFATASMVIHEIIPILLMTSTNLGSLLTLYAHGNAHSKSNKVQDAPVIRRVPAERRAAKVILALILLFIMSWGASVISVNYFNYNRGASSAYLLVIARFSNSAFIALSPIILAVGHRRLRAVLKSIISY
ncbi:olfactory receptor class A-like protein 4 [Pygocentrus nattereri]|uniref:G-protein coupled receptors family 1 profile domain-containing protein n=1 Tax=Pygocentrus nattereri TaxID=42514 RepID=A0A3B4CM26_PYGNA|nr:olfactory receptor class A-like protein 4 [Pygocentrus nattereri]